MNGIKSRIRSVSGTMQITKAMELVATSKLRRQKERAQTSRPYRELLAEAIRDTARLGTGESPYFSSRDGKTLWIVIAGDRGLAGGYNSNIFRAVREKAKDGDVILPIGKKALEHYMHIGADIISSDYASAAEISFGDCIKLADTVCGRYLSGKISRVALVYTRFISMLTQIPTVGTLLPLTRSEGADGTENMREPMTDDDPTAILDAIIPGYVAGYVHAGLCEALASESGARRTAMNSANKNAQEMIDDLTLRYNRARQSVITQEITEIVSGAEAL